MAYIEAEGENVRALLIKGAALINSIHTNDLFYPRLATGAHLCRVATGSRGEKSKLGELCLLVFV